MATNPMFNNAVSPNQSTAPSNPLNDSYKTYKRGYNNFNFSRTVYNTLRYADITPFESVEGVEKDILPFGSKHEIRAHTFKAPLMSDIFMKKNYFLVDNKALLPRNWDKVYVNPNRGDDIDAQMTNCTSNGLFHSFGNLFNNFIYMGEQQITLFDEVLVPSKDKYNSFWRLMFLLESVFSNGSLLSSLGCRLSPMIRVSDPGSDNDTHISFDEWLETTLSYFVGTSHAKRVSVLFPQLSYHKYFVNHNMNDTTDNIIVSSRTLFDMMRTYQDFDVYFSNADYYTDAFWYLAERLSMLSLRYYSLDPSQLIDNFEPINFSRPLAYQLVCSQFYTNDSVDNVFSSDLFLQNAESIALKAIGTAPNYNNWPRFTYNGIRTDYDVFSGYVLTKVANVFMEYFRGDYTLASDAIQRFNNAYDYYHMLLFYRKSLRYGDYFTGAKTRPLAIGDVNAEVIDGSVSAIDMTRSILKTRFLHAVERAKRTFSDYLNDVTDGVAPPRAEEPRWLTSSTHRITGYEVENTAQEQGNIVTVLKSQNSNFAYEVSVGSPCVILGLCSFEVQRVYSQTIDRQFFHIDRFDMFNKFMQNTGDQEIKLKERNSAFPFTRIFGYTLRHMEYKQRYPIACGGFVENLPGYAFITDNVESNQNDIDFNDSGLQISSSFIRHRNSEFDRFYASLSGLTLASYFHFIMKFENIVDAKRQMEYTPTIL